jgi:hypothetical protein
MTQTEPEKENSNKGLKQTGRVYQLVCMRNEMEIEDYRRHGKFDTIDEALELRDKMYEEDMFDLVLIDVFDSMWEMLDEPKVCPVCGYEDWYMPEDSWTYVLNADERIDGHYCSRDCLKEKCEQEGIDYSDIYE